MLRRRLGMVIMCAVGVERTSLDKEFRARDDLRTCV